MSVTFGLRLPSTDHNGRSARKCPAFSGRAFSGQDVAGSPRGRELACFREGEDHLAADLVLVVPEAGVDRVEWAKQLVGNAVRSPHTRQAYLYALEQFFQWAAGRAISRESVQGYVTWLGEMKFSPSTINQRLAAIRKLATEAAALWLRGQRDGAGDCHGRRRECQRADAWAGGWRGKKPGHYCRRRIRTAFAECGTGRCWRCW